MNLAARCDAAYRANELAPLARAQEREVLVEALDLPVGASLLEVGAWDGYLMAEVSKRHRGPVVLTERADLFVERLRARWTAARVLQALQEEKVPLTDGSVDRVAALVCLHHVDAAGFVREAHRVLRHDGLLALVEVPANGRVSRFLDRQVGKLKPDGHHGRYLTPASWNELLVAAGFADVVVRDVLTRWHLASMSRAVEYCRLVFGLTATDDQISAAIQTLAPAIAPDGVSWSWPLLSVTGVVP